MSIKEALEKKLETQLEKWENEIEEMKAKARTREAEAEAEKADAELQQEYYDKIEKIQKTYDQARKKLVELRAAGNNAWEGLKSDIENFLK
ncbi:MAG: hypothetical protein C4548_05695 [Desulfobacteraceae bacterium]|jgi:predicted ribosome quality control (RQC) complex YloA/Tae2 family protein|nr:MAG: hypothetical protein C4548_05695 [Desulfobacteraceae bacterium]